MTAPAMRFEDTLPPPPQPLSPPAPLSGSLRAQEFRPPRRRWPGLLAAAIVGGGITAAAVSSFYDHRSFGARIDAGVGSVREALHMTASDTAAAAGQAAEAAAAAVGDAAITAAVKTALAADPALSALRIEVNTTDGVVRLDGPAPDARARQRAEMLAAAPQGVVRVDNRLVVEADATSARL